MRARADFLAEALSHRPAVYRVALRLTRSPGDAEDLVQETFATACAAWFRYRPGTNCRAWLAKIVENCFISHRRRDARFRKWVEVESQAGVAAEGEASVQPCMPMSERILAALRQLPEGFGRVVVLCDVHGATYREAAQKLGIPIGTVMSRLHRARRLLKSSLAATAAEWGFRAAA